MSETTVSENVLSDNDQQQRMAQCKKIAEKNRLSLDVLRVSAFGCYFRRTLSEILNSNEFTFLPCFSNPNPYLPLIFSKNNSKSRRNTRSDQEPVILQVQKKFGFRTVIKLTCFCPKLNSGWHQRRQKRVKLDVCIDVFC